MVKCFLSPTLSRDPCVLCTFTPANVLQLLVCSTFTTLKHFHLGTLSTHGVSECVWLWTCSSSFASQLCRRSSEDRRPLGQLQNNESLKSFPILLCVGTLPTSPRPRLLPLLHPPPSQLTQKSDVSRPRSFRRSCF